MPLLSLSSLVLRNLRMGDTSRVVTVFSRDIGKWSGVAKGVREPKSRFGASLEILSLSTIHVYFRSGRDLQMIGDASLDREFPRLLRGADRYHHACAVLEFLDRVLEEEAAMPELFDLGTRVLDLMESAPRQRLNYLLRAFQLRASCWLGYPPRLDRCVCGSEQAAGFGPAEGGVVCPDCIGRVSGGEDLSPETLAVLRALRRGTLPRDPSREAAREVDRIAEAFLAFHLDRYQGLRSMRALHQIGSFRRERPDAAPGSTE